MGWMVWGMVAFLAVYVPLVAVATWRLAHDFAREEGPLGLYGNIRRQVKGWAEAQIDASPLERPEQHPYYWIYVGIDCPRCLSFFAALAVLLVATSPLTFPLLIWWGVAGLVSWLDR